MEINFRELVSIISETSDVIKTKLEDHPETDPYIGKYVIVRCRDAGVHAGVLQERHGRECRLTESRRLWYWKPANDSKWLSGLSKNGLQEGKIGTAIDILLTENCEIIPCSAEAEKSIREYPDDTR